MAINDKIRNEKLQYDINREASKVSVFSSDKIDKNESLTRKESLPPDEITMIEQVKFSYPHLGKALEK